MKLVGVSTLLLLASAEAFAPVNVPQSSRSVHNTEELKFLVQVILQLMKKLTSYA